MFDLERTDTPTAGGSGLLQSFAALKVDPDHPTFSHILLCTRLDRPKHGKGKLHPS